MISHPDHAFESAHLDETVKIIRREHETAINDRKEAEGALSSARMYEPDALPIREMLYTRALMLEHGLEHAISRPYFTRLDFAETGKKRESCYIGKHGVIDTRTFETVVSDWRAPIANLYYSGQIGSVHYETPEGRTDAELFLKRQFSIDDSKLTAILDADIVSQDEYLKSVLASATGDKLRDIVTTIQAEQNNVIRCPLEKNLIVQGVAGSGKTTVALHRIAYLLYAYSKKLEPENMLILAPSPLFLTFISQVLPDLGVEAVNQTTYSSYMTDLLEIKPVKDTTIRQMRRLDSDEYEKKSSILRMKGSDRFIRRLEKWLDEFIDNIVPEGDMAFGPVKIFTEEQLRKFILEDEKGVPLTRRLFELKKQIKIRVKSAREQLEKWYENECSKKIINLPNTTNDKSERAEKAKRLRASLEKRKAELKAAESKFTNEAIKRFGSLVPGTIYFKFLESIRKDPIIGSAAEYTLESKALSREDIAPLMLIALRCVEIKKRPVRHIVIDEAQDFSCAEIYALTKLHPSATFTIVGDLTQGIVSYRAISSWDEIYRIFTTETEYREMETSYRSSVEIMNFASTVNKNMPVKGVKNAKPVLRHGDDVIYKKGNSLDAKELALEWHTQGMHTVAIIADTNENAKRAGAELELPVLDPEKETSIDGVSIIAADAVKGLEFDAAIILNADNYQTNSMDARLLYVSLTRALHKMAVFEKSPSPLLKA